MRALVCEKYGPPEELVLKTVPDPEPGRGQIAVSVKAAGVNFPDVLSIAGKYQVKTEPPFVPGNEAAGVVTAVGEGVTRFEVGDEVLFLADGGTFAERCIADEATAVALIPGLNFTQAAGFTVTYGTSYHALVQRAQLRAGETVLVLGAAGGVGTSAIEISKALGATVIAAASTDSKLEFARQAGADQLVNYAKQSLNDAVKALTNKRGADVVYDPVGGEQAMLAFRATAWHGRYLVVGFASGDIPAFPANIALLKEASVLGVWWGTWARKNPSEHRNNIGAMGELIARGKLPAKVTEAYPIDDYVDAFAAITERRALGKVVLTMD